MTVVLGRQDAFRFSRCISGWPVQPGLQPSSWPPDLVFIPPSNDAAAYLRSSWGKPNIHEHVNNPTTRPLPTPRGAVIYSPAPQGSPRPLLFWPHPSPQLIYLRAQPQGPHTDFHPYSMGPTASTLLSLPNPLPIPGLDITPHSRVQPRCRFGETSLEPSGCENLCSANSSLVLASSSGPENTLQPLWS